ncbi:hypothetical protein ACP70R_005088 [Stipagrostis hirtigluma subsp. patula]
MGCRPPPPSRCRRPPLRDAARPCRRPAPSSPPRPRRRRPSCAVAHLAPSPAACAAAPRSSSSGSKTPSTASSTSLHSTARALSRHPTSPCSAALGVIVDCPDAEVSAEEWSEIDLQDPPPPPAAAADKPKHNDFITPWKSRSKKDQDASSTSLRPPLALVDQNHPKTRRSSRRWQSRPLAASSPRGTPPPWATARGKQGGRR